jgi:mycofactocin biosynthesis protein MftB
MAGATSELRAATSEMRGARSAADFDLDRAWRVDPQVVLRPESFGALAYHYGTRRLSFLKSRALLEIVQALDHGASARETCRRAGVAEHELALYARALAQLAQSGMISPSGRA